MQSLNEYQFNFDFDQFLANNWHKKPVIIRQGFANFADPISPDEVAGLAMEEDIDSRFVENSDGKWQAKHGPFDNFDNFPDTHSQLIVQAANHWHPGVRTLAQPFEKLPNWLLDDVMICLSMPEGGVGPHIDQYDVFIIQGMGKRRWRVGPKGDYEEANLHSGLRQITGFEPIIDEILYPGDILYIPPGFPHEGNTIDVSLSYSVGYRSYKQQELLSHFADFVLEHECGDVHLHAPQLKTREKHGVILDSDYQLLNEMLQAQLSDEAFKSRWLGKLLSQSRHELDIMSADPKWSYDELYQFLQRGQELEKVSGLKTLYYENNPCSIFINGEEITLPKNCAKAASILCDEAFFTGTHLECLLEDQVFMTMLTDFCNQGYWYPKA